jgi:hypothetical protein
VSVPFESNDGKKMFLRIMFLVSTTFFTSHAYSTVSPTLPKHGHNQLDILDSACNGCVKKGVILFGNDRSNLGSGKFFDNFFIGSKPKGFMLANAPDKQSYKEILSKATMNTQVELEAFVTALAKDIRLIVWQKDFRAAHFLEPKTVTVHVKDGVFEKLKAGKTHCEKDLCQPTATIIFQDIDGEQLKLRYFSTWASTISRKNSDVEKNGSSVRYGNLYFGHDNDSVNFLGM